MSEDTKEATEITEDQQNESKDRGIGSPEKNKASEQLIKRRRMYVLAKFIAILAFTIEILTISITVWFFVICFKFSNLIVFIFHPCLEMFGCVLLMSMGLLEESGLAVIGRNLPGSRTSLHMIFMSLGSFFVLLGLAVVTLNKSLNNTQLQSNHDHIGWTTATLSVVSLIMGIILRKFKGSTKYTVNLMKVIHYTLGLFTYYLGGVTMCVGFHGAWFKGNFSSTSAIVGNVSILVIFMFCSLKAFIVLLRRLNYVIRSTRK